MRMTALKKFAREEVGPVRAVQITDDLASEANGTVAAVRNLAFHLGCTPDDVMATGIPADTPARIFRRDFGHAPVISRLHFSRALAAALDEAARTRCVLHAHGLWLMPTIYPALAARRHGAPLVISPHGMLAPAALAFSPLLKRLFWYLAQKFALEAATCLHATSAQEAEDIRRSGLTAPIAIIANGVETATRTAHHDDRARQRTLLFLGRLHPKKGIPDLIAAWATVAASRPDWHLRIAGPDEGGHLADLQRCAAQTGSPRIEFTGPVFGAEKAALLADADLFVLPTQNENFGIAVAEALSAGVPAIVTKGAPWAGLKRERCGWWIDHGTAPLAAALLEATALPASTRSVMGQRGRDWVAREFGWPAIAQDMKALYQWLGAGGEKPAFVHTGCDW